MFLAGFITLSAFAMVGSYRYAAGHGYPLDDSYIHFAFAKNLASGAGFGINPHEPAPGATSPLWVLLLAVGFAAGAGHDVWPWILGGAVLSVCGLTCAQLCFRLLGAEVRRFHRLFLSAAAGLTTACCFPLVWSAAAAMEAPLFGACLMMALMSLASKRPAGTWRGIGWGIAVGLSINARPEGLMLIPLFAAAEFLSVGSGRWKRPLIGTAAALALTLPYSAFCLATSGRWFANTYYAKTLSTRSHVPEWSYLGDLVGVCYRLASGPAILAIIAVGGWILFRGRSRSAAAAGLAFVVALPLSYATMDRSFLFAGQAGNFGRYLHPLFPPLIAIGVAALGRWAIAMDSRSGTKWGMWLAVTTGVLLAAHSAVQTVDRSALYVQNVRDINRMQVTMARELEKRLPPGALVAANDVGALACLTKLRVLDLVGIVSTDVLNVLRPRDGQVVSSEEDALFALLSRRRPAAMAVFPDWYPSIVGRLRRGLDVIAECDVPDNVTSGGERLVGYRVDWSRVEASR